MKKALLVFAIFALMVGCTKYASQEQLDELQARKDAVESLKSEIKSAQEKKADLEDEKIARQEKVEELEKEIAELEEKTK
ncbi:MAG: hypothetical protein U9N06_04670 [candidate division WOR-3 bacterium]|nr:hypothetical protein [candidate division WOR-3 bacterium]